ncbi:ComF family protein [Geotalea daltonii]|uniref:ComF family protein n=1 Tax=Geotalea daltonii TaxID=1203471 RepID=UPI00059EB3E5|nr:ComF family protein [Geotalea daltonii]
MLFRSLLDIIFPPLCHLCRVYIPNAGDVHLCTSCLEQLHPVASPLCPICGVPFATEDGIDHRCGACSVRRPAYVAARAAFVFDGPIQELIHRFKYAHKTHLSRPLALMTARHLADFAGQTAADIVIPVPLHKKRLRWRSYNQAILLAAVLSKEWRIPLSRNALQRTRWTEPQINLAADERQQNVKGAFAVAEPERVADRRIILIDDVFTTGSTVEECAKTLKKAGAAEIFIITVARALSN